MILLIYVTVTLWFFIMCHVMIAFRNSALKWGGSGIHHLLAGIFWIMFASVLRGWFWDILPVITGRETFTLYLNMVKPYSWPNVFFYSIMTVGGIRLMYGFWLLLPEEDRTAYNLFTAAFYPKKLKFTSKEKL